MREAVISRQWQLLRRSWVEEHGDGGSLCGGKSLHDGVEGDLELHDEQIRLWIGKGGEMLWLQRVVRLRREDDTILPSRLIDNNHRHTRILALPNINTRRINPIRLQGAQKLFTVGVRAYGAEH